jgi:uncharacterized membrane protein
MSLKDFLQGKWLGHPLHPALVHIPTGLFPAALVFDLLARWKDGGGDVSAARCALWCVIVGLVAALAAAPTGLADWWDVKPEKPASRLGVYHMVLNGVVVALMTASLIMRLRGSGGAIVPCAAANVVLAASVYLGGRMVFDKGVGIARLSKEKWRKIAKEGGARLPAE